MEALCKQKNLQCHFREAVYGKDLDKETLSMVYNKKKSISEFGRELTKGEIGCALSHMNIYKHMIEQNIEKAIVFEDDIYIAQDFSSLLDTIDNYPNNWELILFGYHKGPEEDKSVKTSLRSRQKITAKHTLVRLVETSKGAHGYLISLRGAKKLMKQLSIIKAPIDLYTNNDKYINLYAITPRFIRVHDIFGKQSNLESERRQKNNASYLDESKPYHKLKKEILRPFKQFWNRIKILQKQLKQPKKYT